MAHRKIKSIGVATLKSLGTQYISFVGVVDQVTTLHVDFEAELVQVLNLLHQKRAAPATKNDISATALDGKPSPEKNKQSCLDESVAADGTIDVEKKPANSHPWLRKLFKKIATHCHPDKVMSSKISMTEKHRRMSFYEQARTALDENDEAMMISIGLMYDEIAEAGVEKSKKILTAGMTELQSTLNTKQKSVAWTWGMSEDNLGVKAKILVHAAQKLYNVNVSESDALKLVKEYFEIRDILPPRKPGTHPGPRIKKTRG